MPSGGIVSAETVFKAALSLRQSKRAFILNKFQDELRLNRRFLLSTFAKISCFRLWWSECSMTAQMCDY